MSSRPAPGALPAHHAKPPGLPPWLLILFPFLRWWKRVDRHTLRFDLIAGLTGAVVVLPQGVAFATIAGMPPEYGLYAGMVPAVIAALWGSSWHLVSGPTTAASIVLFSTLSVFAEPGTADYVRLALTLTFMVGILELAMGLARLGTLVNFISHSVVVGFTAGAAFLIAGNQVKNFFGLDIARGLGLHEVVGTLLLNVEHVNPFVTGVAVATLALGLAVRQFFPRFPYMIAAMVGGSLIAYGLNQVLGVQTTGISTVGALPSGLPPLSMPDFSLDTIRQLAPAALAVSLFALTEAVSIARSLGSRAHQHIDGNQEFIGQGLSNIGGAFFSGYVATGSFNRSGLNYQAGAKTPLAAVLAGAFLVGVVVLVAPMAAYLPNAAMAAILFLVAWGLIDFHAVRNILRTSRSETTVLGVTFFSTLFLQLEFAILAGVLLSLGLYLNRTSRPKLISRVPDPRTPGRDFVTDPALPECPQIKIARLDGSLFFGAVNFVAETLHRLEEARPAQRHLIISATGINFIDVAGAEFLVEQATRRRAEGGGLYLIRLKPGVCEPLNRGGYIDAIGRENLFKGKTEAIATVVARLDPETCRTCTARIFRECAGRPGAATETAAGTERLAAD
ncbi:SulP family inorganic anion transporter [Candidatus Thiodictyon syntrophicum]|jgi:SulP family sulfate permease|uniref:Sodium-independent anion transporter n=1 Tax=Candidatus Thiodictyon syntrophicum TaxID=1166950 RepID=A0A2K8UA75_9GAMM|nr:SulP family inorganic anion transporter [Candidatus Thiodictyon syntrophicum]AUB81961.1 sodium-independent anion transporter [Candidatus Thiodictyon syntrophicum]